MITGIRRIARSHLDRSNAGDHGSKGLRQSASESVDAAEATQAEKPQNNLHCLADVWHNNSPPLVLTMSQSGRM
jgi:hypothetical protein